MKLTFSHLQMDGLEYSFPFGMAYFSGATGMLVSGSVSDSHHPNLRTWGHVFQKGI